MVLLEKLWDDVLAGPQPEKGLGKLRKLSTKPLAVQVEGESSSSSSSLQRSVSMPGTPGTPVTPATPSTPQSARKENVWRSVFHPGSNIATKKIGAEKFDKPQPNSPTVYDWFLSPSLSLSLSLYTLLS
ncbi:Dormancy-associated-like protein 1 isoform 1 [Cinnamomum micranthum f. kanehirae]|uniref:Dormancy-associated-like protein 1 isoform 1 n=1 Tax=Cinnamomum micranthum f. kanehirae TaxID=337451 RepID=A0A3S3NEJ6_9MAGN|nr:Dormancy-associated-like protein 1 isoform 1 [Cinnamomum micranthum f. kanehirae]